MNIENDNLPLLIVIVTINQQGGSVKLALPGSSLLFIPNNDRR